MKPLAVIAQLQGRAFRLEYEAIDAPKLCHWELTMPIDQEEY